MADVHEVTVHYTDGVAESGHLQIDGKDMLTDWPGFANDWFNDGLANAAQWAYVLGIVGTSSDESLVDPADIDLTGAPPEVVLPDVPWLQRAVEVLTPTALADLAAAQASLDALGGAGVSLIDVSQAMAAALAPLAAAVPGLQVTAFLNPNPTPPSIDIFPADGFQEPLGYGADMDTYWTVRARTTTADHESGQRGLLALLDRSNGASVENALTEDQTLGGVVQSVSVAADGGVSGYRVYLEDPQGNGSLIGCEWRVRVLTKEAA